MLSAFRSLALASAVVTFSFVLATIGLMTRPGSDAQAATRAAADACSNAVALAGTYGDVRAVVRSELSDASAVAEWQEERHAPAVTGIVSPLRQLDSQVPVYVCIYAGTFQTPTGPPLADGTARPPHTNLRLLITAEGSATLDAAGYDRMLVPDTPGDWQKEREGNN